MKSMTGYGRDEQLLHGCNIQVEVRSVNHRFFEFSCKTPKNCGYLDDKLKAFFKERISRGKISVNVYMQQVEQSDEIISVNKPVADQYVAAMKGLSCDYGLMHQPDISDLVGLPNIFVVTHAKVDEEQITSDVLQVASAAADKFVQMRQAEGERLKEDILNKCDNVLELVSIIEKESPKTVQAYRDRLYEKLKQVLEDTSVDESRIVTEAAIFADRIAVDEETVRLRSHVKAMHEIVQGEDPMGRKLDFLIQEFNREANTIGSKCLNADIAHVVVGLKSEIEKIREQIQNVE